MLANATDSDYAEAGAEIFSAWPNIEREIAFVVSVDRPSDKVLRKLNEHSAVIS